MSLAAKAMLAKKHKSAVILSPDEIGAKNLKIDPSVALRASSG
jgi:hypothetical protein